MKTVSDYINNDCKALKSTDFIFEVLSYIEDKNYSHYPVVEEELFMGSLAVEQLENFDIHKTLADYQYSLVPFFASENLNLMEIIEIFAKNNTNLVPVVNQNHQYVGYYEIESIVTLLNQTPFFADLGTIIIVRKTVFDYSIGQITQIIESNNGKILGLFISDADYEMATVTVKIAMGETNNIIQAFRRYDYEIISSHQDDQLTTILKDRSAYLEKYLSI